MREALLKHLADGALHGGDGLGREFGVSRATIWKHVRYWRQLGIHIEGVPGQGYRITGGLELLDRERICTSLRYPLQQLEVHSVLPSTNRYLSARAGSGADFPGVCLAEMQTAGCGRRGRRWYSPFGSGIYLSLLWRFECGVTRLEGLSLAIAVSVVEALQGWGAEALRLKWPNDIQWGGRKLGGILLEMHGDPDGSCEVVAGIGLNIMLPPAAHREPDLNCVDLQEISGQKCSRNLLAADLIDRLLPLFAGYERRGFFPWRERWQALDAMYGREVVLHSGERRSFGVAAGIDEKGGLRLDTTDGLRTYHGGELSLRTV